MNYADGSHMAFQFGLLMEEKACFSARVAKTIWIFILFYFFNSALDTFILFFFFLQPKKFCKPGMRKEGHSLLGL